MGITQQYLGVARHAIQNADVFGARQAIYSAHKVIENSPAFQSAKDSTKKAFDAGKDYAGKVRLMLQHHSTQSQIPLTLLTIWLFKLYMYRALSGPARTLFRPAASSSVPLVLPWWQRPWSSWAQR